MCKCVLYYCHRVTTVLQLTNISYQICGNTAHVQKRLFPVNINQQTVVIPRPLLQTQPINAVRVTNGLTNKIRKLLKRGEFATHLTGFCKCDNHESQKEKSHEKMWGIVKDFMTVEICQKKGRISGIPKDHYYQEVFEVFKGNEKYGLMLLNLETVNTSEQDAAQISLM